MLVLHGHLKRQTFLEDKCDKMRDDAPFRDTATRDLEVSGRARSRYLKKAEQLARALTGQTVQTISEGSGSKRQMNLARARKGPQDRRFMTWRARY